MKGKHLITTDSWFVAPDGNEYKSVWGDVEILTDSFLGIKTNARSANWFARIGTKENHIIVAGCQIHYAIKCNERPDTTGCVSWDISPTDYQEVVSPNRIYCFE